MSEKRDDGGPAFPQGGTLEDIPHIPRYSEPGMSLRDYFAAKAMAAYFQYGREGGDPQFVDPFEVLGKKEFASQAYAMADAMLEARQ